MDLQTLAEERAKSQGLCCGPIQFGSLFQLMQPRLHSQRRKKSSPSCCHVNKDNPTETTQCLYLYMGFYKMAVQLNLLWDVNWFRSNELQQRNRNTRVPGGDSGLGFEQITPVALQVGGWGAVQGHVGQLVIEHAVIFRFDVITLSFSHQTLRDQQVWVGVRYTLTGSAKKQQSECTCLINQYYFNNTIYTIIY